MIRSMADLIIVRPMLKGLVAIVLAAGIVRAQEPTLERVLSQAAQYVARYQTQLRGLVAEETYRQNMMLTTVTRTSGSSTRSRQSREGRELKSDLLLVQLGDENFWMQ